MLGLSAFSEFPFATAAAADSIVENVSGSPLTLGLGTLSISGEANLSPTGSPLTLATGTAVVSADANISVTGNGLTMATGTVTVTAAANVSVDGSPLTLDTKDATAITWSAVVPGATMVWTPIEPY